MYPEYCVVTKSRIQRRCVPNQSQRQNMYNIYIEGDIIVCVTYCIICAESVRHSRPLCSMSLDHSHAIRPAHPK